MSPEEKRRRILNASREIANVTRSLEGYFTNGNSGPEIYDWPAFVHRIDSLNAAVQAWDRYINKGDA